ncbi:DM13 domain-containing protein [Solirubrobacter soli]|uniref:DM13 domain-containing protein n=1 Tax=Solirubrobacter soli TaxID=363832 RepID=UPI0003F9E59C|nr:DM13 domain-containing protein [Solirubrobacter soli]
MGTSTAPRRTPLQLLVVPLVAAGVVLGVWVAGGVITDDFRVSIALTTVWMAVAAGACLLIAIRSRPLRVPVLVTYVLTAGSLGVFLASTTLRDRVVDERVFTVSPPVTAAGASPARPPRPENRRLARGRFTSGEHATRGTATIVRLADRRTFVTLTSFSTSPGPDLRVRLASARTLDGGAADAVDLGALKGNRGNQQYRIPSGVSLRGRAVVIWCRAFSARFGSATLITPLSRAERRTSGRRGELERAGQEAIA